MFKWQRCSGQDLGFPKRGANPKGVIRLIFSENCMKIKKIGTGGGVSKILPCRPLLISVLLKKKALWKLIRSFCIVNSRCNGEIHTWEFYARRAGILYGAMWREVAPQLIELRGRNTIQVSESGTQVIICEDL